VFRASTRENSLVGAIPVDATPFFLPTSGEHRAGTEPFRHTDRRMGKTYPAEPFDSQTYADVQSWLLLTGTVRIGAGQVADRAT